MKPHFALRTSFFVVVFVSLSQGQEIPVLKDEVDQMVKLGVVNYSGPSVVDLVVPDGFMGDAIRGRVLLVNDGELTATISEITTSCGCTSAIPIERMVPAGKRNLLLITYQPKSPGSRLLNARFMFGEQEFRLTAKAVTYPRFKQLARTLQFDENGCAQVEIQKQVKTPLDRLIVFPSTLRVAEFKDGEDVFGAKIHRDPERTGSQVSVIPAFGTTEYSPIDFELRYPGLFEVLPRRVVVTVARWLHITCRISESF